MDISVIVPVFNEEANIEPLHAELNDVLRGLGKSYEVLFVDDGSTDKTPEKLRQLRAMHPHIKAIVFSKNFGQTAALAAGFKIAQGEVIITMDGDRQNDPHDIPALIETMNEGYDVVSGWRRKRKDPFLRVIASRLANWLISKFLALRLHDYGCTLKAFRKGAVHDINLYGEMHRFIPAVASWGGARVGERSVHHRCRAAGKSNYGYKRIIRVFLDLLTMIFLSEYRTKPIRFFGGLSIISFLFGIASFFILCYMKIVLGTDMTGNPFIILTTLFLLVSVQLLSIGFVAEINIRTYYESQRKSIYNIKEIIQ